MSFIYILLMDVKNQDKKFVQEYYPMKIIKKK